MIKCFDDIYKILGCDCDAYPDGKYWYARVISDRVDFFDISDIEEKGLIMIGSGMYLGEHYCYFRAESSDA